MHQRVGPALLVRQLVETYAFDLIVPEALQRFIPAVAFDDQVLITPDSERIIEAPAPNTLFDLLYLFFRVILRVVRIRC